MRLIPIPWRRATASGVLGLLVAVMALASCAPDPVRARMPGDRAPPPPGISGR